MARPKRVQDLHDDIMIASARRCCICKKEREVQIHHIDGDPENNVWKNLAVLCLKHHSRVSGKQGFGRSYSQSEVHKWKTQWEADVAESRGLAEPSQDGGEEADDSELEPAVDDARRIRLDPDEPYGLEYFFAQGATVTVWVECEEGVDVYVGSKRDWRIFQAAEEGDDINYWACESGLIDGDLTWVPGKDGTYVVWFDSRDDAPIKLSYHVIVLDTHDDEDEDDNDEDEDD